MMHLRCGDDISGALAEAALPGDFVRWADPLCQGPTPADLPISAWRETRAQFISRRYGLPHREALTYLVDQDTALEGYSSHDEVVLWFEHDLFDQVILIYLLTWLAQRRRLPQISMICIGSHPEVERFTGLGMLNPAQLAALFPRRREVTAVQFGIAQRAWRAFTSTEPLNLVAFLEHDLGALPYLKSALKRHLREFPSLFNGLGLTEQLALEGIGQGVHERGRLFRWVHDREEAPWLGDLMFWPVLDDLAADPLPLITGAPDNEGTPLARDLQLTSLGLAVLDGQTDATVTRGTDRWLAGVHIHGNDVPWRWDSSVENLVIA